jgi:predicted membrane protein
MYAHILFLLGIRSWGFVLLMTVLIYLVWMSINSNNYTILAIYASLIVLIYGGAILFSVVAKKNRRAFIPVKYTFDRSEVVKETASSSQTLKWNVFHHWRKIGPYYLIYMTKRSFFVIPKVRIPEEQMNRFESLLSQGIPRK